MMYNAGMPKRSSKRDPNLTAFDIVAQATGGDQPKTKPQEPEKNPAAVALGRLGGLKGGKARAKALSAKKRQEIARKAAKSRWKKRN
jgi:hypothetical protein